MCELLDPRGLPTDSLHSVTKVDLRFHTALVAFVERRPAAPAVELGLSGVLHQADANTAKTVKSLGKHSSLEDKDESIMTRQAKIDRARDIQHSS